MNRIKYIFVIMMGFMFTSCIWWNHDEDLRVIDLCGFFLVDGKILDCVNYSPEFFKLSSETREDLFSKKPYILSEWKTEDGKDFNDFGTSKFPEYYQYGYLAVSPVVPFDKFLDTLTMIYTYYPEEGEPVQVVVDKAKWSQKKCYWFTVDFTKKEFHFDAPDFVLEELENK